MELPKRKHTRLKNYDYSQPGYYYVTIHTQKDSGILSNVGQGLAPAEAKVFLSAAGKIAQEQLFLLEKRYPYVRIDKYVIMPTHIHVILEFRERPSEINAHPTLMDVIGAYKSLTTRICNQVLKTPGMKRFQNSFYETVLRNERAYRECWRYIDENPQKWALDPEDR